MQELAQVPVRGPQRCIKTKQDMFKSNGATLKPEALQACEGSTGAATQPIPVSRAPAPVPIKEWQLCRKPFSPNFDVEAIQDGGSSQVRPEDTWCSVSSSSWSHSCQKVVSDCSCCRVAEAQWVRVLPCEAEQGARLKRNPFLTLTGRPG